VEGIGGLFDHISAQGERECDRKGLMRWGQVCTMVKTRTEYRRTMDAMHEKAPSAKIARSADFSRIGRWMLRRRGIGRARMKMSIRMFSADVATIHSLELLFQNRMSECDVL
jgi:hypothetical protein